MDQICDAGVVTDLKDNEMQEETIEVIDELLFKLKQMTEDRDICVQTRNASDSAYIVRSLCQTYYMFNRWDPFNSCLK